MAIHAAEAEAQDIEAKIAEAAIATEALARRIFGDAAYLIIEVEIDRETGDEETVFEVHYGFEDPVNDFDRIAELTTRSRAHLSARLPRKSFRALCWMRCRVTIH